MRRTFVVGAALLIGAAAICQAEEEAKPDGVASTAHARQAFEQRCANCHVPPDLRFATDRAWLDQVRRTA